MKNKIIKAILSLSLALPLCGCSLIKETEEVINTIDEIQEGDFGQAEDTTTEEDNSTIMTDTPSNNYEGLKYVDMKNYPKLADVEGTVFVTGSLDEILDVYEKKTVIGLLAYPNCIWCNLLLPYLNQVAKENGVEIVYLNVTTDEMTTERYEKMNDLLFDIAEGEYFYTPSVFVMHDGLMIDSVVGVPDNRFESTGRDVYLNEEEEQYVLNKYQTLIQKYFSAVNGEYDNDEVINPEITEEEQGNALYEQVREQQEETENTENESITPPKS